MRSGFVTRSSILGLGALALLLASGCQDFFTTSLAKPLARPPQTLTTISATEAAALVAANPSQALAASAVGALADLVAANPTSTTIVSDAAQVAVIATGLDTALTQALASVDVTSIMSGGSLSSADATTISNLLTTAVGNVNTDTTAIFTALATQASSDPAALAASGTSSQTLIVAAMAVAVDAINTQLASSNQSIADVLNGTVNPATLTIPASAQNLAAGASAIDPGNQLLSMLTTSFNIPL